MHMWRVFVEWSEEGPAIYGDSPPPVSYCWVEPGFHSRTDAEAYLRRTLDEHTEAHGYVQHWWTGDEADKADRQEPGPRQPQPTRTTASDAAKERFFEKLRTMEIRRP